jgi:pyrroline-5-carboxylate reductase
MEHTVKVGFIGAGKMAEAIVAALIKTKTLGPHEIMACDIDATRRAEMRRRHGINAYSRVAKVVDHVDAIVLAVKPQDLNAALAGVAERIGEKHLVLSIAAGRTIASIERLLPRARVVRVMPNLPAVVEQGMSAFCLGSRATAADRKTVLRWLTSFGRAIELPEERFDAVTALSGSGPAFFAELLAHLVEGAVAEGLNRQDALLLGTQTMLGTAQYLVEASMPPADLTRAVASAKGTTAAGLEVMRASAVKQTLIDTIRAAARRSRELAAEA